MTISVRTSNYHSGSAINSLLEEQDFDPKKLSTSLNLLRTDIRRRIDRFEGNTEVVLLSKNPTEVFLDHSR